MSILPSGTVTFLFTDIEGSTHLWQEKPQEMSISNARHDAIMRDAIESNDGTIFQIIGDSFTAAFRNALDGLGAALSAQRGLLAENWGDTGQLRVRMGLHTGAAEISTLEPNRYAEGYTTIAAAQRVMSAAHGGQVLFSRTTYDLLQNDLPENVTLLDMGEHRLKDLRSPLRLYQLIAPDLPQEFPPIKSLDILPNNLPVQLTHFVGREGELAEVEHLLAKTRLLTLTGPGGTGKTRLSLQAAAAALEQFPQGAWLVELAPVTDQQNVVQTVANVMTVREVSGRTLEEALVDYLRYKTLLLVLDNCEHLIEACARLVDDLLHTCPNLKILASSRESLGIAGEVAFRVPSLSLPPASRKPGGLSPTDLEQSEAVRLFVERAQAISPTFCLEKDNATAVAQICRRLDGIPLAIELAAARVKVLSPSQIASRLDDRFRLLTGGSRTALPRQQTLKALIDWSWTLLSDSEKTLLRRLAVFAGGFTLEAIESVCANLDPISAEGTSLSSYDVLDLLEGLVNKSLVLSGEEAGRARYRLLETIRQYAALKLEADALELQTVQEQHSLYYLSLLVEKADQLHSKGQKKALAELTQEVDNIRAAWDWSVNHQIFIPLDQASIPLWDFYELRSWFQEGEAIFDKTAEALRAYSSDADLGHPDLSAVSVAMLNYSAFFKFRLGRSEEAYHILSPGVAFLRKSTHQTATVYSLGFIGITCWELGRFNEAREYLQESLQQSREHGNRWVEVISNEFLGVISHDQGDYHQAQQYLDEALAIIRQLGDPSRTAHVLSYLGRTLQGLGEYSEAEKVLWEGLGLTKEMGYHFGAGLTLDALGQIASTQGRMEEATAYFSESAALFQDMGDTHRLSRTLNHQGLNYLALGNAAEAHNAFLAALRMAQEGGLIPSALDALAGLAALELHQKANQEALELVLFILQHPASNQETKNLAGRLQAELETKLSPQEIKAVQNSMGIKNLEEFILQVKADITETISKNETNN